MTSALTAGKNKCVLCGSNFENSLSSCLSSCTHLCLFCTEDTFRSAAKETTEDIIFLYCPQCATPIEIARDTDALTYFSCVSGLSVAALRAEYQNRKPMMPYRPNSEKDVKEEKETFFDVSKKADAKPLPELPKKNSFLQAKPNTHIRSKPNTQTNTSVALKTNPQQIITEVNEDFDVGVLQVYKFNANANAKPFDFISTLHCLSFKKTVHGFELKKLLNPIYQQFELLGNDIEISPTNQFIFESQYGLKCAVLRETKMVLPGSLPVTVLTDTQSVTFVCDPSKFETNEKAPNIFGYLLTMPGIDAQIFYSTKTFSLNGLKANTKYCVALTPAFPTDFVAPFLSPGFVVDAAPLDVFTVVGKSVLLWFSTK